MYGQQGRTYANPSSINNESFGPPKVWIWNILDVMTWIRSIQFWYSFKGVLQTCSRIREATISARHDSYYGRRGKRWMPKMQWKGKFYLWKFASLSIKNYDIISYISLNTNGFLGVWSWKNEHKERILSQKVFFLYQMQEPSWILQRNRRSRWWGKLQVFYLSLFIT